MNRRKRRAPKLPGRIPLLTNLRIYVFATEEEWEWSGPETERKATAFIRRVIRENRSRERFLLMDFWGSTDGDQDFDCSPTIDAQRFFEVRRCIVEALAKRAALSGGTEGEKDLALATALNGGRRPESAPPLEASAKEKYDAALRLRGGRRARQDAGFAPISALDFLCPPMTGSDHAGWREEWNVKP